MKKQILVMGIPFSVHFSNKVKSSDGEDLCGECDGVSQAIRISTSANKSINAQKSTLLHEYCHAVLYVTGQAELLSAEQEEAIVVAMEYGFYWMKETLWDQLTPSGDN